MKRHRGGFIYLDILLAVFIAASGALLLREAAVYGADALVNSRLTAAAYLAQAEMERLKSGYSEPQSVTAVLNGQSYQLSSMTAPLPDNRLQQLTVEISWPERGKEQTYRLILWKGR